MTKEEIKSLIASHIEGQGNQVDSGSVLPVILNGILDLIPEGPGPGPTPSAPPKDVNFRDYDGSIVASYTKAEFAALTAMPANPTHEGLTGQGWNWTLAKAQAYVAKYGRLEVGQMYITSDGKTRIYITLTEGRTSPYLGLGINGSVDIDWGDGSPHDTATGADENTVVSTQHNYAAPGDYVIAITPAEGTSVGILGNATYGSTLLWNNSTVANSPNKSYQNSIKKLELGQGLLLSSSSLRYCGNITSITIPDGLTSIGNTAFGYCYSLASITIPDGLTSIENGTFISCYSLISIALPDGLTSIGVNAFNTCYSLTSITIPDSVASIGTIAFNNCLSLLSITIPDSITSIDNNTFANCSGCTSITIPDGLTSIGISAFAGCYSLTSITIPDSVASIGTYAFSASSSIKNYYVMIVTPPSINANVFQDISSDAVIYVPAASVDAYKAKTGWSSYASQIQALPE